jgi:O-acetyl-ADP-ribose deacetylase (regulator of RNase III)
MADVQLWNGDICDLEVDAIVNAASTSLWMSTGVSGAIKHRGGDEIEFEAVRQGPVALGSAVVTGAGRLAARYVIHAVSLGADRRTDARTIEAATRSALAQAERLGVESIAFPALGTGVGGFPLEDAAQIMVRTIHDEMSRARAVRQVVLALRGGAAYRAFEAALVADATSSPAVGATSGEGTAA